ncbi:hypothetical protein [Xanthomonas phage BUDD]|nr:hypothetical protein [Xanthomonas phage BUDD]
MTYRDTYFFDLCREAGFNPADPADWVDMSLFAHELDIVENAEACSFSVNL